MYSYFVVFLHKISIHTVVTSQLKIVNMQSISQPISNTFVKPLQPDELVSAILNMLEGRGEAQTEKQPRKQDIKASKDVNNPAFKFYVHTL